MEHKPNTHDFVQLEIFDEYNTQLFECLLKQIEMISESGLGSENWGKSSFGTDDGGLGVREVLATRELRY